MNNCRDPILAPDIHIPQHIIRNIPDEPRNPVQLSVVHGHWLFLLLVAHCPAGYQNHPARQSRRPAPTARVPEQDTPTSPGQVQGHDAGGEREFDEAERQLVKWEEMGNAGPRNSY